MISSAEHRGPKKAAGLSRLVAREAWRLIIAPSHKDVEFLQSKGVRHPIASLQESATA
jgi:hypothetical protein